MQMFKKKNFVVVRSFIFIVAVGRDPWGYSHVFWKTSVKEKEAGQCWAVLLQLSWSLCSSYFLF